MEVGSSLSEPDKAGYLYTLSGSSFLGKEKWRRKYYVLAGSSLYRYKSLDEAVSERNAEKVVSLVNYDICERDQKNIHSRAFVFTLDGKSENLQSKYVFAADSHSEMQDWIGKIGKILLKIHPNKTPQKSTYLSNSKKSEYSSNEEINNEDITRYKDDKPISDVFSGKKKNFLVKDESNNEDGYNIMEASYSCSEDSLNIWDNDGYPFNDSKNSDDLHKQVVVDLDVSEKTPKIDLEIKMPPMGPAASTSVNGKAINLSDGELRARIKKILKDDVNGSFINLKSIIEYSDDYTMVETVAARTLIATLILFISTIIAGYFYFDFLLTGLDGKF
ncbi:hypothetical protein CHUAL_012064 [Chamberlinius hualienensis]